MTVPYIKEAKGVGKKIRKLRNERGLTQEQLAWDLYYSNRASISKWETGMLRPPQRALKQLAEYFDVPLQQLSEICV